MKTIRVSLKLVPKRYREKLAMFCMRTLQASDCHGQLGGKDPYMEVTWEE